MSSVWVQSSKLDAAALGTPDATSEVLKEATTRHIKRAEWTRFTGAGTGKSCRASDVVEYLMCVVPLADRPNVPSW